MVTPAKAGAQDIRRFRMIARRASAASNAGFFSVSPGFVQKVPALGGATLTSLQYARPGRPGDDPGREKAVPR